LTKNIKLEKKNTAQILINQMLKPEIKKKFNKKRIQKKKYQLKEWESNLKKKTNGRMDNFGLKG